MGEQGSRKGKSKDHQHGMEREATQLTCKSTFSWTNFSTSGSNFLRAAFSFSMRSFSGACEESTPSARVLSLVAYFSKLLFRKIHLARVNDMSL